MTDEEVNCKLELTPIGSALSPVVKSGHLPVHCVNISVEISAHKLVNYDSSVYSWQLDIKYSTSDASRNLVWRNLPLLKDSILVRQNSSLQDAIDSAFNGSTIYVNPGSYREHMYINKSLQLVSTSESGDIHIFGGVSVNAPGVILQGMTFYPAIKSFSTISVYSSFVTVVNCRFVDRMESQSLYSPRPTVAVECDNCPHLQLVNNDFYGWKHAVVLRSTIYPIIQANTFRSCQTALSITSGDTSGVTENLFSNNIVGLEALFVTQTDALLNTNSFSGNVIPLFCCAILYPNPQTSSQISKHIQISNKLFVTGVCSMEVQRNKSHSSCFSIVNSEFAHGTLVPECNNLHISCFMLCSRTTIGDDAYICSKRYWSNCNVHYQISFVLQ